MSIENKLTYTECKFIKDNNKLIYNISNLNQQDVNNLKCIIDKLEINELSSINKKYYYQQKNSNQQNELNRKNNSNQKNQKNRKNNSNHKNRNKKTNLQKLGLSEPIITEKTQNYIDSIYNNIEDSVYYF